jgi:osmotically-inducible protein OsmY
LGDIQTFIVQIGRFFRRRVIVPYEWVDRIEEESVYLSANKDDLQALPDERPDSTLVVEVERALWEDVILRRTAARGIHVTAGCGVIVLEGYVSSSAHKARAGEAARRVPGVLAVRNRLVVDDDLKIAAARAAEVPLGFRERVFVGVHNGFVILNGEVSTVEARTAVEQRVAGVPQVRGVLNTLRVMGSEIDFTKPRALQPKTGAQVYAADLALGSVERAVLHPVNRLVVAMVVNGRFPDPKEKRTRLFPDDGALVHRRVVIPVGAIRHQTHTAVFLEISSIEAAKFEDFDPASFALPEAGWSPPYPYHREDVLLRVPSQKLAG